MPPSGPGAGRVAVFAARCAVVPRTAAMVMLALGLSLAASGCASVTRLAPSASDGAASVAAPATAAPVEVAKLLVGDCFDNPGDADVASAATVTLVTCTEPHAFEVFAGFDLPIGSYPGEDAVVAAAEDGCGSRFEAFTGSPYDGSQLDYNYVIPPESGWTISGNHLVSCLIDDPAGPVTGTLAQARR
ncbi:MULTISPECIES: septum formation family protein [unclassified Cryobacterium]|uniref:septum formation family protein n=1 Tax=unclassified Cryobacterium TaxID=2649013 RepID=UPI002B2378F1|nr:MULTISPECIES: septum formation family protein [unclassified Cryobacterium]MEB0275381.1 septum formation family protein [Cryobacterium sp. 5B3]